MNGAYYFFIFAIVFAIAVFLIVLFRYHHEWLSLMSIRDHPDRIDLVPEDRH